MLALWLIPISLAVILQGALWFSNGGLLSVVALKKSNNATLLVRKAMQAKNNELLSDIVDLRKGHAVLELNARTKLGMIKKGEVFYRVIQR